MLIIERFEGNTVIIENGDSYIKTDKKNVPQNAAEGDILIENNGIYEIDKIQTEKRRSEILKLQNSLWE